MSAIGGQIQSLDSSARKPGSRAFRSVWAWLERCFTWLGSWRGGLVIQGLLVFAVGFGFHAYLAPYGVDPHHDGIMFKPALDVSQGRMVFRDTFTQYGGVTVLLQAAALKLFGARLLVLKLQTAVTYGLVFLVFWRAWCRLVPPWVAMLFCFVGSVLGPDPIAEALPWSSVFALLFQGLTLLWAIRYWEAGREYELVLSGMAAALAFWCRQPVGVFLAAAALGAIVVIALRVPPVCRQRPRAFSARMLFGQSRLGRAAAAMLLFGGGLLLVNAIILLWLAQADALIDWWKQSIVLAKIWSEQTGRGHSLEVVLERLFPGGDLKMWCLLAVAALIQTLRSASPFLDPQAPDPNTLNAHALLAGAVSVSSWMQYYPVACVYHCYWAAIPMLGVVAHLLYSTHSSRSTLQRSALVLSVSGLLFFHDAKKRIDAVKPHIKHLGAPITQIDALRGMSTTAAEATCYDVFGTVIDRYLEAQPGGTIVTSLGDGLFPALTTEQASYHPFYINWATITPQIYPDRATAYETYVSTQRPLIVGEKHDSTHVHVATVFFWGYAYTIHAPRETLPTEFIECNGAGVTSRRAL